MITVFRVPVGLEVEDQSTRSPLAEYILRRGHPLGVAC